MKPKNTTTIRYSSNNSGGRWWLEDKDWTALEKAGWKVEWFKDDPTYNKYGERFLGALAAYATRTGLSRRMAIAEWEEITGQDSEEEGCECCGHPHSFYEEDGSA